MPELKSSGIESVLETFKKALAECAEQNWDGYGAAPVKFVSVAHAIRFLELLPEELELPEVSIDPDGEAAFEWIGEGRKRFSVSFGEKGRLTYAGLFGENKMHGIEMFIEEIPNIIIHAIKRALN
jgi:hypothetical protein